GFISSFSGTGGFINPRRAPVRLTHRTKTAARTPKQINRTSKFSIQDSLVAPDTAFKSASQPEL
ncbi:MAG: hypothetical protein KDI73_01675, partial [Candidatus Competibacteraceae bacterium]|nr:hypothetical protein [Candidatus Competibacteraceae bacterium]